MNARTDTEVQAYLDRLRRELAGLPAAEIEEIVQDLEPQVSAIAADPGTDSLIDRLGDPAEYARELRSALGMPDEPVAWRPPPRLPRTGLAVLAVTTVTACVAGYLTGQVMANEPRYPLLFLVFGLFASWLAVGRDRSAMREITALPELRLVKERLAVAERHLPVAAYLTSLWPGMLLVKAAFAWLGTVWLFGWFGWLGAGGATAAVTAAVLTVLVGNRAHRDRRWLWLSIPLGGWAVGVAVKAMELLPMLATGDHVWP
ncbi:DUF1700 domain-containing protein [Actinophytocola sp.]|uniref:DUF1700 domain-containing protein n=1 Tax=Actinophytocola sp. TaxID=1872138 RepID=UPI002ED67800